MASQRVGNFASVSRQVGQKYTEDRNSRTFERLFGTWSLDFPLYVIIIRRYRPSKVIKVINRYLYTIGYICYFKFYGSQILISKSYDGGKAWSSINHSIFSGLNAKVRGEI